MKRLRALFLAAALTLCAAPMLVTTASAAETNKNLQSWVDDYNDSMNNLESSEGFLTEEQVEQIKEYLSELLNLDALKAAGDAINVFFENTYISRVFFTAFLMSLISFIMRGN